jgi:hypothetical protein
MKLKAFVLSGPLLGLACCTQSASQSPDRNEAEQPQSAAVTPTAPTPRAEANVVSSDDRTPLAEPKGPIDPKGAEAAGQVVQHYGALIEGRRFAEAEKLWGDADTASEFTLQLKRYPEAHLEIGKPGNAEGAAGSVYLTEPVTFYGKDQNSASFRRSADVILRRVNDVPGSTEAQRRWHIERIEWKDKA